jgi:predicted adenylyl cyclase CyaB
MQNLEQKFRSSDLAAAEVAAQELGATDRGIIHQRDLFFPAPNARLKLRLINGHDSGELIAYRRADREAPSTSEFLITPVDNPDSMAATLTHALGKPRELTKTRHLYIYQNTRIHIDHVDKLGGFVELECLLTQISRPQAEAELQIIVAALGLKDAISEAYVDLLV